jgi:hypothetical protein
VSCFVRKYCQVLGVILTDIWPETELDRLASEKYKLISILADSLLKSAKAK